MRLLFISPFLPYPPRTGGRTRLLAFVKALREKHELMIAGYTRPDDLPYLDWYRKEKLQIVTEPRSRPLATQTVLRSLSVQSVYVGIYISSELRQSITSLLERFDFDLIHIVCSYIIPNVPLSQISQVPLVVEEPNLESVVLRQHSTLVAWPLQWLFSRESNRLEYVQRTALKVSDRYICSSPVDAEEARSWSNSRKVRVVPNGVDSEKYSYAPQSKSHSPLVLFLGNFSYFPNVDAIEYFVHRVFPVVVRQVSGIQLKVIGYQARHRLRHLQRKGVILQDFTADISADLAEAWVSVCPLRSGSGSPVKILESMAVGTPVVSSPVGTRGLPVENGKHLLVSSLDKMGNAIVELVNDPILRETLASNARRFVEEQMSWEQAVSELEAVYGELA